MAVRSDDCHDGDPLSPNPVEGAWREPRRAVDPEENARVQLVQEPAEQRTEVEGNRYCVVVGIASSQPLARLGAQ
jgi:hypothetical protein